MTGKQKIEKNSILNEMILCFLSGDNFDKPLEEYRKIESQKEDVLFSQVFLLIVKILNSDNLEIDDNKISFFINEINSKLININPVFYIELLLLQKEKAKLNKVDYFEKLELLLLQNLINNYFLEKIFLKELLDYYIEQENIEKAVFFSKILREKIEGSKIIEEEIFIF